MIFYSGRSKTKNSVIPWLIHVNVWQKPLQYCKVISLQLIKINGKKIKTVKRSTVVKGGAGERTNMQSMENLGDSEYIPYGV